MYLQWSIPEWWSHHPGDGTGWYRAWYGVRLHVRAAKNILSAGMRLGVWPACGQCPSPGRLSPLASKPCGYGGLCLPVKPPSGWLRRCAAWRGIHQAAFAQVGKPACIAERRVFRNVLRPGRGGAIRTAGAASQHPCSTPAAHLRCTRAAHGRAMVSPINFRVTVNVHIQRFVALRVDGRPLPRQDEPHATARDPLAITASTVPGLDHHSRRPRRASLGLRIQVTQGGAPRSPSCVEYRAAWHLNIIQGCHT